MPKAIANKNNSATAIYSGYTDYAGQGLENLTSEDLKMPFLQLIQPMSPTAQGGSARPGDILQTASGELFEEVYFVPVATKRWFCEWRPRSGGGGFVAHHSPDEPAVVQCISTQPFGRYNYNGNDLVDTRYVYGVTLDPEGNPASEAAISFSSSKIKVFKVWMTKAKSTLIAVGPNKKITAPLFSHAYKLGSVVEKNTKGTYYNWNVTQEFILSPDSDAFLMALSVRELFSEGLLDDNHEPDAV